MQLSTEKIEAQLAKFERQATEASLARLQADAAYQRVRQSNPHQRRESWPALKRDAQAESEEAEAKWTRAASAVRVLSKVKERLGELDALDHEHAKMFGDDVPVEADLMAQLRELASEVVIAGDLFEAIKRAQVTASNEAEQMTRHTVDVSPSAELAPERARVLRRRSRLSNAEEQARRERTGLQSRYTATLERLRMVRERGQIEQERAQIQRELDAVLKENKKAWEVFK